MLSVTNWTHQCSTVILFISHCWFSSMGLLSCSKSNHFQRSQWHPCIKHLLNSSNLECHLPCSFLLNIWTVLAVAFEGTDVFVNQIEKKYRQWFYELIIWLIEMWKLKAAINVWYYVMQEMCSICVANLKNKHKWDTKANTVELSANLLGSFTITEKAPTRAFP